MGLNKQKLLEDLKAQIGNLDAENDTLCVYQIGRNSIASHFFIAISSGIYDEDGKQNT
jgi:hypothetical protein